MESTRDILKRIWGYPDFRPGQAEIVDAVMAGQDALALLPTGGGKSLCYQVPALAQEGLCIVVSPLIALMEDQVTRLRMLGVTAASVTSTLKAHQIDTVLDNAVFGRYKFLYISPERLQTTLFIERFKRMKVNLIAVDEAHCISEWGHDFRPAYRNIAAIREHQPDTPVLALTATATPETVTDIQNQLGIADGSVFQKSFKRDNLAYLTLEEPDKFSMLLRICGKNPGTGIVYAPTRRQTQLIANFLGRNGVRAEAYHAGLDSRSRSNIQQRWIEGHTRVVAATSAFGMGIDKADVRFVVHLHVPASPEAYFQEAGRGGRDGKRSHAMLLWEEADLLDVEDQFEQRFPDLKRVRTVYEAIGGFLRIALGAGEGTTHPFQLGEFVNRFNWKASEVYRIIGVLEMEGYLSLSESFHHPATLQLTCNRKALYEFQVRYPALAPVIDDLLRSQEGLFEHPCRLDMRATAKRLQMPEAKLSEFLMMLHQQEIGVYAPSSSAPLLTFNTERLPSSHLLFDTEGWKRRKAVARQQVNTMRDLVESNHCRSQLLLSYFGEAESEPCGVCDVCRGLSTQTLTAIKEKEIHQALMGILGDRPVHATEAVGLLREAFPPAHITHVLRKGADQGVWKRNAAGLFFAGEWE